MGDEHAESSAATTTLMQPARDGPAGQPHEIAVSLSFASASITQALVSTAPRPTIQHNGLHPLHPSSSSASLSLSMPQLHTETPEQYKVGQYVDVKDPPSGDWFQGQVTRLSSQGIHIHYIGWPGSADTIIPPSQSYQRKHLAPHRSYTKAWTDENDSACSGCGDGGDLICCDRPGCVKVWHLKCVNLKTVPKRLWTCPDCRGKKVSRQQHAGERKEASEEVSKRVNGLQYGRSRSTARKTQEQRRSSLSDQWEDAPLAQRALRKVHRKQWADPLEAEEADENDWQLETKDDRTDDAYEKRERQQRLGVKWSLRPLRHKRPEESEVPGVVKFEDEDDDEVRRLEMKYRSDDEDDEDYQQKDTPAEEESEEDVEAAEEEKMEDEDELLPEDNAEEYEAQPLIYRRYRRPSHTLSDGEDGRKRVGYGKQNSGKRAREESRKRKRDAEETAAKTKRARLEQARWNMPELPLDDEEAREELQEWMSTSRKRAVRSRPDSDWRYQQDDERLEEEGETAEERAEREHDTAVRNERRKQQRKRERERMICERMWNSSAVYAVLQQLDTLTLLQLVAITIERMRSDVRIQALATAAPSLQSLLSTVSTVAIAEAYASAPPTSPPSFPPPPPKFSSFLASLHALVLASVTHHSAELHTYRFFILRSLDWQWRQYIRQHTQTINALWVQMEARQRPNYQIKSEMKAEERQCEEWRKKFSQHWEVAQRMHDRLEAEERELREWSEWCETRRKEAEDDEEEEAVESDERKEQMNDTEAVAKLEARRERSGMLIVALCMCLLMKWRAMGPVQDVRKAFDAILVPTPPPAQSSSPPSAHSAAAAVSSSSPSLRVLHSDAEVHGDDDYVNLDHTIALSTNASPRYTAAFDESHEAATDHLYNSAVGSHQADLMDDNGYASCCSISSLRDDRQYVDMEDGALLSMDDDFADEPNPAVHAEVEPAIELDWDDDARSASQSHRHSLSPGARVAAASEASHASGSSSPQPTSESAKSKAEMFLPFLSLPVLTADGFESHTLTDFPDATGSLPLLPIAIAETSATVASDTERPSSKAQAEATVVGEDSGVDATAADVNDTAEACDEPIVSSPVNAAGDELQPCRHTCGCAEPPDTLFADRRPHERDRVLHPLCNERSMNCNALFRFTPTERAKLAAVSRARRSRRFAVSTLKKCRHKCGCSVSRHKRFDQVARRSHEREESLHIHCKSLGLECAALFEKDSKSGVCRHTCGSCTSPAGTVHEFMRKHEKQDASHPQCRAAGGECVTLLSTKPSPTLAPPPDHRATDGGAAVLGGLDAARSGSDGGVCSHECGCVLPAGEVVPNIAQHERSVIWHPHCTAKGEACVTKLVHRQREFCRHACGCVDGALATYFYRLSHEAKHSKHPLCAEKGLECAKLLSAIDDRQARLARQAEQRQQRLDDGKLDDEEDDVDEDGNDMDVAGSDDDVDMTDAPPANGAAANQSEGAVCPHQCGVCKKAGRFMRPHSVRYHQSSERLHPNCREAGLACSALLQTASTTIKTEQASPMDGTEQAVGPAVTPSEQPHSTISRAKASSYQCRHLCGCLSSQGALFGHRCVHERSRGQHPHCEARGLECAKRLRAAKESKREQRKKEAQSTQEGPSKKLRVQLALQNALVEVKSKRSIPCLHRTSRCDAQCPSRFGTAHEAVQHASTSHKDCACGGRKPTTWRRLVEKRMAKQEAKRARKQKRREERQRREKGSSKKRDTDEQSDHSSSPSRSPSAAKGRSPPSSESPSSASMPTSPYSGPSLFDPTTHPYGMAIPLQPPAPPPLPSFSNQSAMFPAVPLSAVSASGAGIV